ncbi:MAG TPA: hypothetical protein DCF33_01975, partial [Saprospirales bacterium]|nr:hypothetical protein [Saprospirales bacterium]
VIDVTDLDQLTELCLKKSPKGLIMNVKSPTGWDGWAFGAQLQNTFCIPVFFITGAAAPPVNKAFSFPVLNKPFTRVQLKDHLGHWFEVRGH